MVITCLTRPWTVTRYRLGATRRAQHGFDANSSSHHCVSTRHQVYVYLTSSPLSLSLLLLGKAHWPTAHALLICFSRMNHIQELGCEIRRVSGLYYHYLPTIEATCTLLLRFYTLQNFLPESCNQRWVLSTHRSVLCNKRQFNDPSAVCGRVGRLRSNARGKLGHHRRGLIAVHPSTYVTVTVLCRSKSVT